MKSFFKFTFASCLGVFLAMMLAGGVLALVIGRMASSGSTVSVKPNSVLMLDFKGIIPEKTNNAPFRMSDPDFSEKTGFFDMLDAIDFAITDRNIKGVYLEMQRLPIGLAKIQQLRAKLEELKAEGKFVVAYSPYYSQGAYYLASVADEIYVDPMGGVDFRGFAIQLPHFKRLLDKLDIEPEVFFVGEYKSAVEPFRFEKMSDENREQLRDLIEGYFRVFMEDIGSSRGLSVDSLRAIANGYLSRNASSSKELGMVDDIMYKDQVIDRLREKIGLDDGDKVPVIALSKYVSHYKANRSAQRGDRIALVYAEGNIVDNSDEPGTIGGVQYARTLRQIREDGNAKAVVIRVNSGGGSALASDNILREVRRLQEEGIPVVVSMGDVAASGGYYISALADSIFAEPLTITGSIGIFGLFLNMTDFMSERIGITYDSVKTAEFALGLSPFSKMSDREREIIQGMLEQTYQRFLDNVKEGRNMTDEEVHAVARGRIWTGEQALALNLVDRLGTLDDAIASAAAMAGIDRYRVSEYPRLKSPFEQIMEQITGGDSKDIQSRLSRELGPMYTTYQAYRDLKSMEGFQARMMLDLVID